MIKPNPNPIGCPAPRQANAIFWFSPCGMLLVINRTEEGRHKAIAKPCVVRKRMSSMPFRERPQAMVVPVIRNIPRRYIFLPPTTSEMDPKASRVHPQERLLTAGGQRTAKKEELAWVRGRGMESRSSDKDQSPIALRNRNLFTYVSCRGGGCLVRSWGG